MRVVRDFDYFFNYVSAPLIDKAPLNVYVYVFIAIVAVVVWIFRKDHSLKHAVVIALIAGFIGLTAVQVHSQMRYWYAQYTDKGNVPWGRVTRWKQPREFCKFIKENVPPHTHCRSFGRTSSGFMRYELYPHILVVSEGMSPCVIAANEDPKKPVKVPKDFIVRRFNAANFVAYKPKPQR